MSDPTAQPRRRWRDDPLSVFLAVAALVLGGMYLLEQRDVARIEQASALAQELGARLALDRCTTGSASTDGEVLVIECSAPAADAARQVSGRGIDLRAFARVIIAGTDELWSCPSDTAGWPDSCAAQPRPTPRDS